mgnify:CR=1 FL=1
MLGSMYTDGYGGIAQNFTKAEKWLTKAAKNGQIEAQYNLGTIYYNGQGCNQDFKQAKKWLTKAAQKGHVRAQCNLGILYYKGGPGFKPDPQKAVKWLNKSAEQGYALAQYNLGTFYYTEQVSKALQFLSRAAQQGYAPAQFKLGALYHNGIPPDYVEAERWLRLAAKKGIACAQHALALLYYNGNGVFPDYGEGQTWFCSTGEPGYAEAQYILGSKYYLGEKGGPKDNARAELCLRAAAEQGHADAQFSFGVLYLSDELCSADIKEAEKWIRLAAAQGHAYAKFLLWGLCNFTHDCSEDNTKACCSEAIMFLRSAADQELAPVLHALGRQHYHANNFSQAAHYYDCAARQGHGPAQNDLASMYDAGKGVPESPAEARKLRGLVVKKGLQEPACGVDYTEVVFKMIKDVGKIIGPPLFEGMSIWFNQVGLFAGLASGYSVSTGIYELLEYTAGIIDDDSYQPTWSFKLVE